MINFIISKSNNIKILCIFNQIKNDQQIYICDLNGSIGGRTTDNLISERDS